MGPGEWKQILCSIISQFSVLVSGAAYSWFEPLTLRLKEPPLSFTSEEVSLVISVVEVGAFISPFIAGSLTNRVGRKYVVLSIGFFCIAGWVLILISKSFLSFVIARLIHGAATGISFTVTPIYTAEIADPRLRGRLSGIFQVTLTVGSLYSFVLGPFLSYNNFVYACLPLPVVFILTFVFLPETPYYLLMTEREGEAREVLKMFRNYHDVEEELQSMKAAVKEEMNNEGSWRTLLFDKIERKAFVIVLIICFAKFMTGMTVINNYATDAFSKSDSFLSPEGMAILLGIFLAVVAIVPAFMSDWIGRKPLLIASCFGCFFAHLLTGTYYFIHEKTTVDGSNYLFFLYIGILLYCFFLDIGLAPLLQTLQSEMFGASTRGVAAGLIEGFAGFFSFVALNMYNPLNEMFGVYLNFWFYSAVGLIGGILLHFLMYETAGQTIGTMGKKH